MDIWHALCQTVEGPGGQQTDRSRWCGSTKSLLRELLFATFGITSSDRKGATVGKKSSKKKSDKKKDKKDKKKKGNKKKK